ncbi:hypothetical protein NY2A_b454R [Paramecium bursaria Chlorella virus NY2A]|uniref:Uncharacterized protein b454R n=1 Tax=Paramecium bursaria Chlorella virus NY2A TaxID=46021 RepID=A7IWX9_PBCVN|nr:hypothetical protein NY2A_b454R [Paramecium bursaria Chlorella virus NY2A]YP_001498480.1 hypothetical protein AR158_C399R [Paramecium bursaria Chlorella virus AR158]ABT14853.1 hypothetical protein NY2A_b454R [Paramecium bursaria Chlorella virus NY2A]ABU43944.1 hypothetical protein AR158_C399R [Paramecium bursaria Chlorella virus AR158]
MYFFTSALESFLSFETNTGGGSVSTKSESSTSSPNILSVNFVRITGFVFGVILGVSSRSFSRLSTPNASFRVA